MELERSTPRLEASQAATPRRPEGLDDRELLEGCIKVLQHKGCSVSVVPPAADQRGAHRREGATYRLLREVVWRTGQFIQIESS